MSNARWLLFALLYVFHQHRHLKSELSGVVVASVDVGLIATRCESICGELGCAPCDVPECNEGLLRVRVTTATRGDQRNGECCDHYECQKAPAHCRLEDCASQENVVDVHSLDDSDLDTTVCPSDSVRPPRFALPGACCVPRVVECRCRAAACAPVRCAANETAVLERAGSGTPGECCDIFRCKPTNSHRHDKHVDVEHPSSNDHDNDADYEALEDTSCVDAADDESWPMDVCQTCSCHNGIRMCRRVECAPLSADCGWVGVAAGECCPACLGCRDERDMRRDVGESWVADACTNCTCEADFRMSCQRSLCRTECESPRIVAGVCCPVCDAPTIVEPIIVCASVELCPLRCESGLERDAHGCFICRCAVAVASSSHDNTSVPTIDSPSTHDRRCATLNELQCQKACAHGHLQDADGCATCRCAMCPSIERCFKSCLYGFEQNALGCVVCKCRSSSGIAVVDEVLGPHDNKKSSPRNCTTRLGGQLVDRDTGEWWSDGRCRQCFCHDGVEFCSLFSCPRRPSNCSSTKWRHRRPDDCCPMCMPTTTTGDETSSSSTHALAVCHSMDDGRAFVDGETWQVSGCLQCTCRVGHVLCTAPTCAATPCETPIVDPRNECCKICPTAIDVKTLTNDSRLASALALKCVEQLDGGTSLEHSIGATWRHDPCRSCLCAPDGRIRCFQESCQPSTTANESMCTVEHLLYVKGACCAICSSALHSASSHNDANPSNGAVCTHRGVVWTRGERFLEGSCRECLCKTDGAVECHARICDRDCAESSSVGDECCQQCKDIGSYLHQGHDSTMVVGGWPRHVVYVLVVLAGLVVVGTSVVAMSIVARCFYRQQKQRVSLQHCALTTPLVSTKHLVSPSSLPHDVSSSPPQSRQLIVVYEERGIGDTSTLSTSTSARSELSVSPSPRRAPLQLV